MVTTMPLTFIPSAPLQRRPSLHALRTLARNVSGIAVAWRALRTFRPDVVIATGGYVCFPVVVAARLLRVFGRGSAPQIALLELNVRPGLTNRLLRPLVDEVWLTYGESRRYFGAKAVATGAPVRASLSRLPPPREARLALGLEPERTTIVVMGGSQGARSINAAVTTLVTTLALPAAWQVLHISGERDYPAVRADQARLASGNVVRLVPYLSDPGTAYAAADIVVARAGASTLAELAATATPAVLIPYPFAADDHQTANAALFAAGGAGVVLPDRALTAELLLATLATQLSGDVPAAMRAAAARLSPAGAVARIVERITAWLPARVADSAGPKVGVRDSQS